MYSADVLRSPPGSKRPSVSDDSGMLLWVLQKLFLTLFCLTTAFSNELQCSFPPHGDGEIQVMEMVISLSKAQRLHPWELLTSHSVNKTSASLF